MANEWQYHLFKILSRIMTLLPYKFLLSCGTVAGSLFYSLVSSQRKRAIKHIQEGLKVEYPEAERIAKIVFKNIGKSFMEMLYSPRLTKENIHQYVEIVNKEYLEEAVARGKGVVFLTAHQGNWEWLGQALAFYGFPMTTVVKKQPNDQHTKLLNEYRIRAGLEVYAKGTAELVAAAKAIKRGKVLGFIADQDAGVDGLFVDFLGKPASTPTGATIFAKKFQAPVVAAFISRKPNGGHIITIEEPFDYISTGNDEKDIYDFTVKTTKIIEDAIRQNPYEWMWFQRRWNTTPLQADVAKCVKAGGKDG